MAHLIPRCYSRVLCLISLVDAAESPAILFESPFYLSAVSSMGFIFLPFSPYFALGEEQLLDNVRRFRN